MGGKSEKRRIESGSNEHRTKESTGIQKRKEKAMEIQTATGIHKTPDNKSKRKNENAQDIRIHTHHRNIKYIPFDSETKTTGM